MTSPARPRQPAPPPEAIFTAPVAAAFWILLIFMLIDPRGILPPEQHGPASLAILAFQCLLCAIIICLAHIRIGQALGLPGLLMIFAFLSYLVIGFTVSIAVGSLVRVDIGYFLRNNTLFLPALLAAAFGTRAILVRMETDVFLKNVLILMIAGCVVIVITSIFSISEITLLGILQAGFTNFESGNRFIGFHQSPNDTAMIGCATFILALSFLSKSKMRPLAHIGLTVGFLTVLGSLSKTGILTLVATLFFIFVFIGRRRRIAAITWIGLLIVLLLVVGDTFGRRNIFQDLLQQERIGQLFLLFDTGVINNALLTGRGELWSAGLRLSLEAPLYGNGIGRLRNLDGGELFPGHQSIGVHNMYLLIFGESGFLPLLIYLAHTFSLVILYWIAPKSVARDVAIGYAIMLACFQFSGHHLFGNWIYGFLCGLICAIGTAVAQTSARSAPPPARPCLEDGPWPGSWRP